MENKTLNILAVDDDAQARQFLVDVLERENYRVTSASDGREALDILQDGTRFDVIIADRAMPRMDGMELLGAIKSDDELKKIPVIFQTGLSMESEVAEGIRAGVYYYLTKPYKREILVTVIDAAITEARKYHELRNEVSEHVESLKYMVSGTFRIKRLEEVERLSCTLAEFFPDPMRVVTGISELLINSIEHGNLGITYEEKSRFMKNGSWRNEVERRISLEEYRRRYSEVRIDRSDDSIRLMITDMGEGFDANEYLDFSPERATHSHGRGIAMARAISFDVVRYMGKGNSVVATVEC